MSTLLYMANCILIGGGGGGVARVPPARGALDYFSGSGIIVFILIYFDGLGSAREVASREGDGHSLA